MKKLISICLMSMLLVSSFVLMVSHKAEASNGHALVYILCLDGVGGSWVDDPSSVKDGVIAALSPGEVTDMPRVHPKYGKYPPFYDVDIQVITDWYIYYALLSSYYKNFIIINTHGEILPIPFYHEDDPGIWVDQIADAMLHRGVTWVNIAGYPFYHVWHEGASSSEEYPGWGGAGFQRLMSHINKPDVTIPTSGFPIENVGLHGLAEQVLNGFGHIDDEAYYVRGDRPLNGSDFDEYVALPLYSLQYEGHKYYTGAVITFAKPGDRFDPTFEPHHSFGAFVHLGTGQTYDEYENPTDRDYWRGYVGAAAAVWQEAEGFPVTGKIFGDPYEGDAASIVVRPAIVNYHWTSEGARIVDIAFAVYGCLKSLSPDTQIYDAAIEVNAPLDCQVRMIPELSKYGYGENSEIIDFVDFFEKDNKDLYLTAETILFFLSFVPGVGSFAAAAGGLMLYSDWLNLAGVDSGADTWTQELYVDYDAAETQTYGADDYYYNEFESVIFIQLKVPASDRGKWEVIPLEWRLFVETDAILLPEGAQVRGSSSVAIWFGDEPYAPHPAFFEDFEGDLDGWNFGDYNTAAGEDYWGITNLRYPHTAWCAKEGYNSIYGGVPNEEVDLPDWPGPDPRYDKDMDAYLWRWINYGRYRNAVLAFDLELFVEPGDYLLVEIYCNGSWYQIGEYVSTHYYPYEEFPIPRQTQKIQFRFISDGDSVVDLGAYIDNIQIRLEKHPHPYDINDDGIVDMQDIVIVSLAFGSVPGDSNWNPRADIREEYDLIDIVDMIEVAINMGPV